MCKKVSIIIPMYNSEKYIVDAISSACQQTYENIEIVIVDDGSTDNSVSIAKRCKKEDSRIKIYCRHRCGVSAARNYGISKSTGDYVFFLDSDDTIDSGLIAALVANFKNNCLIASSIKLVTSDDMIPVQGEDMHLSNNFIEMILGNQSNFYGYVWGILFEKRLCSFFKEDIEYCEDMVFLIEYILDNKIKRIYYLKDSYGYYNYVQNAKSITKTNEDIFGKTYSIASAMDILNEITAGKYIDSIEDKRTLLFMYEMSRATKEDVIRILDKYKLKRYSGKSLRCKLFSYVFRKKYSGLLMGQFKVERFLKKILRSEKG